MMQSKDGIIARLVESPEAAKVAAAEGANLIMLQVTSVDLFRAQKVRILRNKLAADIKKSRHSVACALPWIPCSSPVFQGHSVSGDEFCDLSEQLRAVWGKRLHGVCEVAVAVVVWPKSWMAALVII
jgi:hypothetical protein